MMRVRVPCSLGARRDRLHGGAGDWGRSFRVGRAGAKQRRAPLRVTAPLPAPRCSQAAAACVYTAARSPALQATQRCSLRPQCPFWLAIRAQDRLERFHHGRPWQQHVKAARI